MTASMAVIRSGLVALLQGITTDSGATFLRVTGGKPRIDNMPQGIPAAWVRYGGYRAKRLTTGRFGQVDIRWRWRIHFAIWGQNDEMTESRLDDFVQAVTDTLTTRIRAGIDPSSGVIINEINILEADREDIAIEIGTTKTSREYALCSFLVEVQEEANYNLVA